MFLSIQQGVYLQLLAKTVYFLPTEDPILVTVQKLSKAPLAEVWVPAPHPSKLNVFSDVAVHLGAVLLLVIALVGAFVQVFHQHSRRQLSSPTHTRNNCISHLHRR